MVLSRGIAPRSAGYQPAALLLSYERKEYESWSDAPVLPRATPDPKSGGFDGSLASDETGSPAWTRTMTSGVTDRQAALTSQRNENGRTPRASPDSKSDRFADSLTSDG
jgi:hypothetical protein